MYFKFNSRVEDFNDLLLACRGGHGEQKALNSVYYNFLFPFPLPNYMVKDLAQQRRNVSGLVHQSPREGAGTADLCSEF